MPPPLIQTAGDELLTVFRISFFSSLKTVYNAAKPVSACRDLKEAVYCSRVTSTREDLNERCSKVADKMAKKMAVSETPPGD